MDMIDLDLITAQTDLDVIYRKKAVTESTNDDLKALAAETDQNVVLFADRQTAGRGRQGRSFFSEGGLYMSVLFPRLGEEAKYLTHMAAVAVAEGIKEVSGEDALVKWVNDVYLHGRKVSGILAESILVRGQRRYILGIGVNVGAPAEAIPTELKDIIGYVETDKNALAARILEKLFDLIRRFDLKALGKRYESLSFLTGKRVYVVKNDIKKPATVLSLSDDLGLIVRYDDGIKEELIAGEVHLIL